MVRTFRDGIAEVAQELEGARSLGIGDSRLGHDVNDGPRPVHRGITWADRVDLDDGIDQHVDCDALELLPGDLALDQEPAAGLAPTTDRRAQTRRPLRQAVRRVGQEGKAQVQFECARASRWATRSSNGVSVKSVVRESSSNVKLSKKKRLYSRRMRRRRRRPSRAQH